MKCLQQNIQCSNLEQICFLRKVFPQTLQIKFLNQKWRLILMSRLNFHNYNNQSHFIWYCQINFILFIFVQINYNNHCYSQQTGIEYYESIQDKRRFFFQKKLNALILFTTQRENEEFLLSKEQIINKRAKFEEESKRIELDLIYSQTESKEAQVKGIVNNHTNQVKQIQSMIQNEMASQTDAFQMRLERRRKSKMAHSLSQTEIDLQSYHTTNQNKKTEFKEQGCIKIIAQTKQIIQEEDSNSRKHSYFQFEQDTIENELLQETKLKLNQKHQRSGSQIPISNISIKQRFLSQEYNQNQEEILESSQGQISQKNH